MIKKITLSLLAIILLASCSSKFGVQKRRYNKGFYVASAKGASHKNEHSVAVNKKATKSESEAVDLVAAESIVENSKSNKANEKTFSVLKFVQASNKTKPVGQLHVNANKKSTETLNTIKIAQTKIEQVDAKKRDSGGGNTVVLVILALFPILCLIAVYLHDGKKVTTNFWIDLILHLTVIGEIIYAILVVLDIVDLS